MSHSQNGWTAGTAQAIGGLDTSPVPGTGIKLPRGVRKGDVATVLLFVAEQFNLTVEPLHPNQCWGYDYRKVRGSATALSNHASGTAIDLNAPAHPLGRKGTFTAKQLAAIHKILVRCEGAVRWGGAYTGRKDEMHFEIVQDASDVALVAKKIRLVRSGHGS
jgi:D-alanyl-D-alanine carboxypeptidase-like protein